MPEYGLTSRVENEQELVLEKVFLVDKETLFEMFSKTEHLQHFWGPNGSQLVECTLDFQPDGEWFYGVRESNANPEEKPYTSWRKVVYDKISKPDQIIYTEYFADKIGEIKRELPVTSTKIDFVELGQNRTMILGRTTFESPEALQELFNRGMRESIAESLERLSKYIID